MKPCWIRSSPFPSRAGRSRTCLKPHIRRSPRHSVHGPKERPVRESNPSSPVDSRGDAHQPLHRATRVSGGSRTRLSDAAGRCLGCSATDTRARTEGVEPSASRLELDCSPGSTPLSNSGRDRTRTCKGFRLVRFPTGCHRPVGLPSRFAPSEAEVRVELTSSGLTGRCLAARLLCRRPPSSGPHGTRTRTLPVDNRLLDFRAPEP